MRGGDDAIYKKNQLLQEYLPRGCVIAVPKEDNKSPEIAIFGNKKFYGRSSGDDDESSLTSESVRRGSFSSFLVSDKANGESCHIVSCDLRQFQQHSHIIGVFVPL